jgi:branched-chain amino acid transport system ATP-binding protein
MLATKNVEAWYGESHVLHGVDLEVREGELVTILGRNGAGKTTTLRAMMGLVSRREGSVVFKGEEIGSLRPDQIGRRGIALCPEERGIFATLSVQENMALPPIVAEGGLDSQTIFTLFPNLKERLASPGTKLSGGEQQMLAIARILRTGARMLLFDEPTEGLAPVIVQQIAMTLHELKRRGFTILLVEQNLKFARALADRHYIMQQGRVVDMIPRAKFDTSIDKVSRYLGV